MFNPADEVSSINFGAIIGGALNAVVNAQKESAETTVNFVRKVGFNPGMIDAQTGKESGIGDPICVSFSYDKEVSPSQIETRQEVSVTVKSGGSGYEENKVKLFIDDAEVTDAEIKVSNGSIESVILKSVPAIDFSRNDINVKAVQENEDKTVNESAQLLINVKNTEHPIPALFQKMEINVPILTMMPIPFIKVEHTDIEFNVKINSVSNTSTNEKSNSNLTNSTAVSYKGWGLKAGTSLNTSISNQKSSHSGETVKKDYSLNIKVHAVSDDMPAGMSRILDILEDSIVTKPVAASEPAPANP